MMFSPLRALRIFPALAAILFATAAHGADFDLGSLRISSPFARATVPQQPAGAAYLSIENRGKTADALIRASSPVAREVQIHSMKMEADVMRMREILRLDIKPGSAIKMKPGDGYHIMLIGLKQGLNEGDKFPMTLVFEKAGPLEVTVTVEGRTARAPMSMEHGHKH